MKRHAHAPGLTATLLTTIAFGSGCTAAIAAFVGGLSNPDGFGANASLTEQLPRVSLLLLALVASSC